MRITYVGHSTVLIELDGLRILTDPVLRRRVLHIVRHAPPVQMDAIKPVDLVIVSHMHPDHFDPASLRMVRRGCELVVPVGGARLAARMGFRHVTELGVGETQTVGQVVVTGTPAAHRRGRIFDPRSEAIGFKVAGSQNVYFAGDTDIFAGMRELSGNLDLALLPVGGWGPRLGPGHLDAKRAAESLKLLAPRIAVPIHWGTLRSIALKRAHRAVLTEPPLDFAREAARIAPSVDVRVLVPGEATTVEPRTS
jgi:L-ascorbate metabolism protein UlaG (beta-lactamase superfamily)